MSLVQVCANVQAAIDHARSMFAASPEPPTAASAGASATAGASQETRTAGELTNDLSGALVDAHRSFVDRSAPSLGAGARNDARLQAHMMTAATITQSGASRLDAIAAATRATSHAAATVSTPTGERVILAALRSQLAGANDVLNTSQQQAAGLAGQVRNLRYPFDDGRKGGPGDTRALGFGSGGAPDAPPLEDPPHGRDPRYWLDLDKIKYVPPGQLAPYGYKQVGPNLYYPDPYGSYDYNPPPPPANHPLDISSMMNFPPGSGKLPPYGYKELSPGTGWYAPDPYAFADTAPSPWPTLKEPIDVRDIIQVPEGKLAPYGYIEYLPGWFVPGPELTNTPTIPPPLPR